MAEAAGVSLRTVYRYFPTRADLLQSAAAWFREFTDGMQQGRSADGARPVGRPAPRWVVSSTSTRTCSGRWPDHELEEPRRAAVAAAVAEVSGNLPPKEARRAEAILGHIRSGRAWLLLHDHYGLSGDEIVSGAGLGGDARLLEDVRRRNEAAG